MDQLTGFYGIRIFRQQAGAPSMATKQVPNYGEYAEKQIAPLKDVLAGLNTLVDEAHQHQAEIDELEEKLSQAKSKLQAVVEDALPKAMREAKLTKFTTKTGLVVTLKNMLTTSVPKDRKEEAWDWLEANKHSDILKREVIVAFAVNEGDAAKKLAAKLAKETNRSVKQERWAEPATLKSRIKQLIEGKKSVPRELFGVREFDKADIKVIEK